ncbi:uncharacterized protein LOC127136552 [Lathyrus oleraceus]|uniref:uncharacterized protein LOC127136552 n=1 Tax=Pisum sativum TaxID=3888 RepID=UPI0021D32B00|nr:uncharacterized protein LOC127136552 [Pisum sativum]
MGLMTGFRGHFVASDPPHASSPSPRRERLEATPCNASRTATFDLNDERLTRLPFEDLISQFCNYYNNNNDHDHFIVLLQNARIGGVKGEIPLKSTSNLQVDMTRNSEYSDLDKFTWKSQVLSLAKINNLQYTTSVTVAILDKYEVDKFRWYYDGCGQCTKSVLLKNGKLKCFSNHETDEPVPLYKLEVQAINRKCRARFVFWDIDYVGEDNPLVYPYALDEMLKKELTIRVVFQSKYG